MNSFDDITNVVYINLLHREDRKQQVEEELSKMGWVGQRFNAVRMTNGAIGCTISHLKVLQTAIKCNWSHVVIIEDDILFLDPNTLKEQLDMCLRQRNNEWDVILLGGNNIPPCIPVDATCVRVLHCQTTTGYLVNGAYLTTLYNNVKSGLEQLLMHPHNRHHFAIDRYWFRLQQVHRWFLIVPLTVVQREGYSDIEKRHTNYMQMMQDLK